MEDIYNIFLVKTIPGILKSEYSMPPIPFVFDENTINGFQKHLDSNDDIYYLIGSRSIEYLKDVRDKYLTGVDGDYIIVNDHSTFFLYCRKLLKFILKDLIGICVTQEISSVVFGYEWELMILRM